MYACHNSFCRHLKRGWQEGMMKIPADRNDGGQDGGSRLILLIFVMKEQ